MRKKEEVKEETKACKKVRCGARSGFVLGTTIHTNITYIHTPTAKHSW